MEKTNLNVTPYYDDFDENKNFHRLLFRPGFAVQARELTQLQTILQNQVERHGRHVFKEGTVVIPGAVGFTNEYYAVKLQSTFGGSDITDDIQDFVGTRITGATSGVVAEVIEAVAGTAADPITLFVKYVRTGSDNVTTVFANGENISSDGIVGGSAAGIQVATTDATSATAIGSSANIEEGVYFLRGHFVKVSQSRLVLDKYTNTPNYRIGLTITETLVTPEEDTSLQDNAQGVSNENAKGAHRLKITAVLSKLALTSTDDTNFVELIRVKNGIIQEKARNTDYSVLGETLARRTYDESGDYTIRSFDFNVRETLNDGTNNGIYSSTQTTDDGNSASEDLLTMQISPGKAYVRGYEIDVVSPRFIDITKPRTSNEIAGAITPVEVGNYAIITNAYQIPDITPFISSEITDPFKEVSLYDELNSVRGTENGTRIGFARARAIEHLSGNSSTSDDLLADSSTTDSEFKLYLFDIRMFTNLTMSGTPGTGQIVAGTRVTGVTSGAYGFATSDSTGTTITLASVVGSFLDGEEITSSSSTASDEIVDDNATAGTGTDLTISSSESFNFENAKQVFMNDADANQDFTADLKLENTFSLSGTVSITSTSDAVTGFGTLFTSELQVGDQITIPGAGAAGADLTAVIDGITDDNTLSLDTNAGTTVTSVGATRNRSKLNDQNKNILLRKLQKRTIKTLQPDGIGSADLTVRRQFIETSNSSGEVSLTISSGSFNAASNTDYVISVLSAGTGSAAAGDIINVNSSNVSFTGAGSNSLTITSASLFGDGAKVKVVATFTVTNATEKTKTRNRCHLVNVENDGVGGGAEWGTSAHHREISLGVADVFKLHAVYESDSAGTVPSLPQWTFTGVVGTFTKGEVIVGGTTGARGIVVNPTSPITYVLTSSTDFSAGETITGQESGATATLDTYTAGSTVVTNNFTLDTGQRDNFYDVSRVVRKSNVPTPTGNLLVVADFFSHQSGDFFTVDSYSAIDYLDIPTYTATRVDPEVREPTGEYDLRDTVDFRPRVADATASTQTVQNQTVNTVTSYSFNFEARSYSGTGSSTINIPKDNSNFQYDFEYYLGRVDMVFLTSDGEFKVISGAPAENPNAPKPIDNAMKLAEISLPPYILNTGDVRVNKENNRRYTMRDIGKLETRINNMEYYTALNLLEKDAQSLQIQDSNGLDRFKSGFLVDNFSGHSTGDVKHPDYRVAIDMQNGLMRPKYYMKGISLEEENTTDADRTVDNYQLTGDLVTLPYTHTTAVEQPYATRVENLNPVLNFSWAGICKLSPSGDEWFEVDRLPDLIINVEGNFDTVLAENRNSIGTVWNAWQTQWTGTTTSSSTFRTASVRASNGRPAVIQRTVTTALAGETRRGVRTAVVAQIDTESQGDRILSQALIPFIRSRNVTFDVTGMKPLTKVYPFFDKTNVTQYVTPTGGSAGDNLITSASGSISGVFNIPDPNVSGNPSFRTGDRVFRLTSDSENGVESVETFAQAIYSATGILNTVQEEIIATRNGRVEVTNVSQSRTTSRGTNVRDDVVGWWDPLAQSFMPQAEGGEYITKIDTFFSQKDDDIPVTCQIREMSNGYPTTKVLPFGSKTLQPADVNVSDDATAVTTFTFDSPVYVKDGVEYCIVLFTDSQKYLCWISRMGETDVGGSRLVSEQPYLGVLFKSQNNTTWTAYDFEDLKFTLYRASFDTSVTGNLALTNTDVPTKTLSLNPIETTSGSAVIKVSHRDHHMHDANNNVIVTGVVSGISTTLNGAITDADTTLTLTSASSFPGSGTVFVKIGDEVISGSISGTTVSSLTRGVEGSAAAHSDGATIELYMLNGIPLTEINKTHTAITDSGLDYYTLTCSTNATSSGNAGGSSVTATENAQYDQIQTLLPVIEHPDTSIVARLQSTTGTSASGSQTSFTLQSTSASDVVPLNDNFVYDVPKLVASPINETNELAGSKSLRLSVSMSTLVENLSPVIDLDRKSVICIANRLDNIDNSSDVYPTSSYILPTEPEGDSNEVVYITRKVQLENPASAIKVILDAVRPASSEIQVMYKVLRSDDASDFDELGWAYFNANGSPDSTVNASTTYDDFLEYNFTADGLDEFIAFAIKIRMQGTNSAEPPLIKDLRAIALAT